MSDKKRRAEGAEQERVTTTVKGPRGAGGTGSASY